MNIPHIAFVILSFAWCQWYALMSLCSYRLSDHVSYRIAVMTHMTNELPNGTVNCGDCKT